MALRTALECEVVDLLCRSEPTNLAHARDFLDSQAKLVEEPGRIEFFRELDEEFHRALFEAAGQIALHALIIERSSHMARLRTLDLPRSQKMHSVVDWHGKILEKIVSRDRQGAVQSMREHLSGTIGRLSEIMATHPDYFA